MQYICTLPNLYTSKNGENQQYICGRYKTKENKLNCIKRKKTKRCFWNNYIKKKVDTKWKVSFAVNWLGRTAHKLHTHTQKKKTFYNSVWKSWLLILLFFCVKKTIFKSFCVTKHTFRCCVKVWEKKKVVDFEAWKKKGC